MGGYVHEPVRWNREAASLWSAGQREAALKLSLEALDNDSSRTADSFIQPAFYAFQLENFDIATKVLEAGLARFPDHPMILLSLGCSYSRWHKPESAIPLLERFLELGHTDASAYDALANSCAAMGEAIRAKLFGTMALNQKDALTKDRHGTPRLDLRRKAGKRSSIIAFTLFGSNPRYLRGALHNVLAARRIYPGWTCRFHVDDSVDPAVRTVLAEEGAQLVMDDSGDRDVRHLLARRFLVADDPDVGYFLVRDCDSVVSEREAAAVAEWMASGLPFHAMRDCYAHTDPMLAGLWGGIARVFPDMAGAVAQFRATTPISTNWDQLFLRDRIWPAVRDHIMVHDRCFAAHAARPFPTPTPPVGHVGQNEFAADKEGQAAMLAAYADRVPALALPRPVKLEFKIG